MKAATAGPTFLSALFGIAIDGSPWQYMLSLRRDGYGGATRVPLGPFGGDFIFLLEPDVLKQALLEDAVGGTRRGSPLAPADLYR